MDELINDPLGHNCYGRTRHLKIWVDIKDVVNVTLIALRKGVPERQIETREADLPPAYVDIRLIRMVIHNLLSNAIKFTSMRAIAQIEIGSEMQAE